MSHSPGTTSGEDAVLVEFLSLIINLSVRLINQVVVVVQLVGVGRQPHRD